jgi:hypothetical protein
MLIHHAIFSVVLGIGAAWPQAPAHYRYEMHQYTCALRMTQHDIAAKYYTL